MNTEIEKVVINLVRLCKKDNILGKNTTVKIDGEEIYCMFRFDKKNPRCKECGQEIKEV